MDVAALIERIESRPGYAGQIQHVEVLPERVGKFAAPSEPVPAALERLLRSRGIEKLYCHQAAALEAARSDRDFVVVTGTASGKTLCYNLPILEAALADLNAVRSTCFPPRRWPRTSSKGCSNWWPTMRSGPPQSVPASMMATRRPPSGAATGPMTSPVIASPRSTPNTFAQASTAT